MLANTYWLKEKYPDLFPDANLETIKIEGEVAKTNCFLRKWKSQRSKYAQEANENRKRLLAEEDRADIGVGWQLFSQPFLNKNVFF